MGEASDVAAYESCFADDSHTLDIIADNVAFLLDQVHMEAEKKRMEALAVPLATDVAMVKIRRLMAWAVLNHDGVVQGNSPLEHLQPDAEPKALTVDPWARGMVPTKHIKHEEPGAGAYRTLGGELGGGLSPRSATGSRVSSNTGTSRSGTSRGGKSSRATTRVGTAGGRMMTEEEDDPTGQIFDLEDEYDKDSLSNANHMSLEQLLKKQAKKDGGAEEEEVVQKTQFQLLQEGIDQQVKDMKVKKYTIDRDGQVIPLAPVKPGSLPPYQVNPDTKVGNYKDRSNTSRSGSRGGRSAGGATTAASNAESTQGADGTAADGKGKRKIRVAGSRVVDAYTFLPSYTLADTLSSTAEQVVPTSGVSVQINDAKRNGPNVPSIPGKMSRKEYATRNIGGGNAEQDIGTGLDESTFDAGSSLLQPGEQAFNDSQVPASMGGAGGSNMRQELQYKMPDVDAFTGGRRVHKLEPSVESPTAGRDADAEEGLGPVSNGGGSEVQLGRMPGPKDPNVRLFAHDTTLTGKPKDRDLPQNMKPPSARTKSVAPPPGQISHFDSPDKARMNKPGQSPLNSPAGSADLTGGVGSPGSKSGVGGSRSKVGAMRSKAGTIKNAKPHVAAQIF